MSDLAAVTPAGIIVCRSEGSRNYIDGIIMPWDQEILYQGSTEVFRRGAFDEFFEAKDPGSVLLNYQHGHVGGRKNVDSVVARLPVGALRRTENRDEGQWGEFVMGSTRMARDVYQLAADGILRGFSVEYYPVGGKRRAGDAGQGAIERAALDEVALTHRPLYTHTTVSTAGSRDRKAARDRLLASATTGESGATIGGTT